MKHTPLYLNIIWGRIMTSKKILATVTTALLTLAACQTSTGTSPSTPAAQGATPAAQEQMRPLKYNEIMRLFANKTFVSLDQALTGDAESDKFARAVTYLRDDINNAYRIYPYWPDNAGRSVEIGQMSKRVSRKPIANNGNTFRNVESLCLTDELRGSPQYCVAVYTRGGKYYFYGSEDAEITFFEGFDTMLAPMVQRANADNDLPLLRLLQADFGTSCAGAAMKVLGGLLGAGLQSMGAGGGSSSSSSNSSSTFSARYELVCRERNLMDVDNWRRGLEQSCTGEISTCRDSYTAQLEASYGSLSKACSSLFGPSYSYENIDYNY